MKPWMPRYLHTAPVLSTDLKEGVGDLAQAQGAVLDGFHEFFEEVFVVAGRRRSMSWPLSPLRDHRFCTPLIWNSFSSVVLRMTSCGKSLGEPIVLKVYSYKKLAISETKTVCHH